MDGAAPVRAVGVAALRRGLGLAASSAVAVLSTTRLVERASDYFVPQAVREVAATAVWPSRPLLAQFLSAAFSILVALLGAGAYAFVERAVERQAPRRREAIQLGLALALSVSALALARHASPVVAYLTGHWLVLGAGIAGGASRRSADLPARPGDDTLAHASVFLVETLAGLWLAWIVLCREPTGRFLQASLLILVFAGYRVSVQLRSAAPATTLRDDAVTAGPLLLAPLVGLLRDPSWRAPAALGIACALVRIALRAAPERRPAPRTLTVAAAASLVAIFAIPLQLRELSSENHQRHESQHYGWIASALEGRLMMADASTLYGPLREYVMAGWVWATGGTLMQVRVIAVLLNVAGAAICLAIASYFARQRGYLVYLFGFLLLVASPLRFLLVYWNEISFGWVDVLRVAANLGVTVGALRVLSARNLDPVQARRPLFAFGALGVLALLYSQEFGLCAAVAVAAALVVHLVATRGREIRVQIARMGRALVPLAAGFATASAVWLLPYLLRGKALLFLRTLRYSVTLSASGAIGGSDFPVHASSFASAEGLLLPENDPPLEYLLPIAGSIATGVVLLARLVGKRWTPRSTVLTGAWVFATLCFRIATNRADVFHLSLATLPSLLLWVALASDASSLTLRRGKVRIAVGGLASLVTCAMMLRLTGTYGALTKRATAVLRGEEMPSGPLRYDYPGVPRAGDMRIAGDTVEAARYILTHSAPQDRVYCRVEFMDGMELYFLTGRRNPTRFDMLAEILWPPYQAENLASLKADPPTLVVGKYRPFIGTEAANYLDENWVVEASFGRYTISRRK